MYTIISIEVHHMLYVSNDKIDICFFFSMEHTEANLKNTKLKGTRISKIFSCPI
jgi:hypothetical protein